MMLTLSLSVASRPSLALTLTVCNFVRSEIDREDILGKEVNTWYSILGIRLVVPARNA